MSKQFEQVQQFNRDLLGIAPRPLGEQENKEAVLSIKQLSEEIHEYSDAYDHSDFVAQIDAIVDLQYFAFGILYKMGLTAEIYEKIFTAVHNANMLKKAGVNAKRGDHGAVDASKPTEWVDPSLAIMRILDES